MRLLLARHGVTEHNIDARFTGHLPTELSTLGRRQAEALAEALAHEPYEPIDALVSSDLPRARQTAEAVAARLSLPLAEDPDLREIGLGDWEGRTVNEVAARDPDLWAAWRRGEPEAAPPGGETIAAFRARVEHALAHASAQHPGGSVLWVTHGGVIAMAIVVALNADVARRSAIRRDNASLTELEITDARITLVHLNDTAHLRQLLGEGAAERFQVF